LDFEPEAHDVHVHQIKQKSQEFLYKYNKLENSTEYTGWLKLKYPTGQNTISRQPCEIFYTEIS